MAQEVEAQGKEGHGHRALILTLAVMPVGIMLARIGLYGLAFPYWDEWRFAEVLQKAYAGQAGFIDFWAQHNEHRILFPRLLMYAMARLTHWDVTWELNASVLFAGIMFVVLVGMLMRGRGDSLARMATIPVFSLFVFSWSQNENWIWGFQCNLWLAMLAVVAGAYALSSEMRYSVRLLIGVIAGTVATYSYANGLLFWPIMLLLVWDQRAPIEQRKAAVLLWIVAAGLVGESYFYGYVKPSVSPSPLTALQHPIMFAQFFAANLGAPVTTFAVMPAWHGVDSLPPMWALLPGPIAVVAFLLLAWRHWQRERNWRALAPWLALGAFSLASAAMTSAGRCGFGLGQALTSRYITITTPLWIALVALAMHELAKSAAWKTAQGRAVALCVIAVCVIGGTFGASHTSAPHEQRCHWKQMAWLSIRLGLPHPMFLGDITDTPDALMQNLLPWMAREKLCGLGTPLENPAQYAPRFLADAKQLLSMNLVRQADVYVEVCERLDPKCPGLAEVEAEVAARIRGQS